MATRMTMPLLGQTMEEGAITRWLKKEGEQVKKGEPLLEVMTDKANMEVESPVSGVVLKILAPADAVVPVKDTIAFIGEPGESIDEDIPRTSEPRQTASVAAPTKEASPESVVTKEDRVFASPRAKKVASEKGVEIKDLAGMGSGPGGRIVEKDVLAFVKTAPSGARVTPLAGKIAADMGVDTSVITGTGPAGKVTRDDVIRASSPKKERPSIGRVIPFSGMRKFVAESVSESIRTAPHVTLVSEVDVTAAKEMREQLLPEIQKRYNVKLTFTALVVKAAALAVLDYPIVNSSLAGDRIVVHEDINIGVATAVEGGLVVPVIRRADEKPLHIISDELAELAAKARAGSLTSEEMKGGTFTITNLGAYGVDTFNPIINPPESAILGVCRIVERPAMAEGRVLSKAMMNLCLSFDHRVMDGAPAAQYLARVREIIASPYLLLI